MPHDIEGMKALRGEVFFIQELELFFDRTTKDFLWSDYYNHPKKLDPKFYPGKKFMVKALNNSPRKCLYPKDLAEWQTARPIVDFP